MKKLILISALLITGCATLEEVNTKLYAGMDRQSFCIAFHDMPLTDPCFITVKSEVEYFPAYKTEIYPLHSSLYDDSDKKQYWYVFENVNQISPVTYHEHFSYAEPGSNPGNFVMSTDNYQEAYMRATGGRLYGVRKETKKPIGKRRETFADKMVEAFLEGVAEGVVDGTVEALTGINPSTIGRKLLFETETTCVYENKDGTQETVYKGVKSVRTRTSPHPLGERTRITTVLEDCD